MLGLCCVRKYQLDINKKARQEQKSDIYTRLISFPPPNEPLANADPQYAFKRILLPKIKPLYANQEEKMSLFHAREYFCNSLCAINIWNNFFSAKRAQIHPQMKGKSEISKPNLAKVKLEALINLVD